MNSNSLTTRSVAVASGSRRAGGADNGLLHVERAISLAFFPGRAPRSAEYREGCRAALEYRILGRSMGPGYPAGCCEADAWFAGVEEGHAIWRRKCEATNMTATDANSSEVSQ